MVSPVIHLGRKYLAPNSLDKIGIIEGLTLAENFTHWDSADYLKNEEDSVLYFKACAA